MKLNSEKSKIMLFNFTKKYQFIPRIYLQDELLEIVNESTILGLVISSDLAWKSNTEKIISKANTRMIILRRLSKFPVNISDLVMLYGQFIRSILEFNSVVWFSSITDEESSDLESVQKTACKLILKNDYTTYEKALEFLELDTLAERRLKLARKFAKVCQNIPQMKPLFEKPKQKEHDLRNTNKCDVKFAAGKRLYKSAVPSLQRLLNKL